MQNLFLRNTEEQQKSYKNKTPIPNQQWHILVAYNILEMEIWYTSASDEQF